MPRKQFPMLARLENVLRRSVSLSLSRSCYLPDRTFSNGGSSAASLAFQSTSRSFTIYFISGIDRSAHESAHRYPLILLPFRSSLPPLPPMLRRSSSSILLPFLRAHPSAFCQLSDFRTSNITDRRCGRRQEPPPSFGVSAPAGRGGTEG